MRTAPSRSWPDETVSSETLDALCLAHLASFKRPRQYVFVKALPKNAYGKVLKTDLRQWTAAPGRPCGGAVPG